MDLNNTINTQNFISSTRNNYDLNRSRIDKKNDVSYHLWDFFSQISSDSSIISYSENDQKVAKNLFFDYNNTNEETSIQKTSINNNEKIYLEDLPSKSPSWMSVDFQNEDLKYNFNRNSKNYLEDYTRPQTQTQCSSSFVMSSTHDNNMFRKNNSLLIEQPNDKIKIEKKLRNKSKDIKLANKFVNIEIGPILSKSSISNNLVIVLLNVLSNKKISKNELDNLTRAERILLFLYMNKRCLISDTTLNNIGNILDNTAKMEFILTERSHVSNFNESGLSETIINRILRYCFEDWIKKKNIHAFNGKYKYKNRNLSNEEINKMFWSQMIIGETCSLQKNNKFEKLFFKISKNIQIKKKRISKKKKVKSISVKKPKYLNIFLKKNLKEKILKYAKNNKSFGLHYKSYISHVFNQYQTNESFNLIVNKEKNENTSIKFSFHLKEEIKKALLQMLKWFQIKGGNMRSVNAKELKVRLKHIACPVTLKDYQNIFESINSAYKNE
jgi:hypothetical protein